MNFQKQKKDYESNFHIKYLFLYNTYLVVFLNNNTIQKESYEYQIFTPSFIVILFHKLMEVFFLTQKKIALSILANNLPPVIARKDINQYLGGLISSGYLANLDSLGKGPASIKSGRRVTYLREDLIAWLDTWLKD